MSDPLTDLIEDIQHNGIRWVSVLTLITLYRKERRTRLLNMRDAALFHNLRVLMEDRGLGDQWRDGPNHGYNYTDLPNLKQLLLIFMRATKTRKLNYPKGMTKMKEYLKKLGSRKFQAFLIIAVTNIIMLTGYLLNVADIQAIADSWMPIINLGVLFVTTIVYQLVQGSVDKEAQKQQVYVIPAAADPAPIIVPDLSFDEIMEHVEKVNAELNVCLKQIKAGDLSEIPKEAVQLYMEIHDLIKRKTVEP